MKFIDKTSLLNNFSSSIAVGAIRICAAVMILISLMSSARAASGGISAVFSNGAMVIGPNNNACTSGLAGVLRFVSSTGTIDVCNGSSWISGGVLSTQSVLASCVAANKGALRYNTAGSAVSTYYSTYVQVCDGSSWVPVDPTGAVAGSNTQIQFNSSGAIGGSSNFTWNSGTGIVNVGNGYKIGGYNALQFAGNGVFMGRTTAGSAGNVMIGRDVMTGSSSGEASVVIGHQAASTTAGNQIVAIGMNAQSAGYGGDNVAVGWQAGYSLGGNENVSIGVGTLYSGTGNTFGNSALGSYANYLDSYGSQNSVTIGSRASYSGNGYGTVAIGALALSSANNAAAIAIGYSALGTMSATSGNEAVGALSGAGINTNSNVMIGYNTNNPNGGDSILNIGNTIFGLMASGSPGVSVGDANFPTTQFGFKAVPPSAETITAAATITVNGCGTLKMITASTAVSTNTTNTFTAPAAANNGCCMDVLNVGTTNNITLKKNTGLFFTSGGNDVVLNSNSMVRVCSNGSAWYEIGPAASNQ